jgi:membrane protein YdbS with pleckstrin-like domain
VAISNKLLNPGEKLILSCRQHVKKLFGPLLALIVLLALGIAVQVIAHKHQIIADVVWVLVVIGVAWFFVRPFLDWFATVYGFTDRRIITRHGIVTRRGHDIPLVRVSDIEIEINLLDRPFGCGSLLVSDASTNGTTRLNDIPHVEDVQRKLNAILFELHQGGTGAATADPDD